MISFPSRRKISLSLEENATHNKTKECARNPRYVRKAAQIWRPYKETCMKRRVEAQNSIGPLLKCQCTSRKKENQGPRLLLKNNDTAERNTTVQTYQTMALQAASGSRASQHSWIKCAKDLARRCLGAERVGTRWKFSVGAEGPKSKGSSSEKQGQQPS